MGPGLTVRPTGVCSFSGVLVASAVSLALGGGGSLVLNFKSYTHVAIPMFADFTGLSRDFEWITTVK